MEFCFTNVNGAVTYDDGVIYDFLFLLEYYFLTCNVSQFLFNAAIY